MCGSLAQHERTARAWLGAPPLTPVDREPAWPDPIGVDPRNLRPGRASLTPKRSDRPADQGWDNTPRRRGRREGPLPLLCRDGRLIVEPGRPASLTDERLALDFSLLQQGCIQSAEATAHVQSKEKFLAGESCLTTASRTPCGRTRLARPVLVVGRMWRCDRRRDDPSRRAVDRERRNQ